MYYGEQLALELLQLHPYVDHVVRRVGCDVAPRIDIHNDHGAGGHRRGEAGVVADAPGIPGGASRLVGHALVELTQSTVCGREGSRRHRPVARTHQGPDQVGGPGRGLEPVSPVAPIWGRWRFTSGPSPPRTKCR